MHWVSLHPHRKRPNPPRSPTQEVPPERKKMNTIARPGHNSSWNPKRNTRLSILYIGYNILIVYT
jgi:hypothetical protein